MLKTKTNTYKHVATRLDMYRPKVPNMIGKLIGPAGLLLQSKSFYIDIGTWIFLDKMKGRPDYSRAPLKSRGE